MTFHLFSLAKKKNQSESRSISGVIKSQSSDRFLEPVWGNSEDTEFWNLLCFTWPPFCWLCVKQISLELDNGKMKEFILEGYFLKLKKTQELKSMESKHPSALGKNKRNIARAWGMNIVWADLKEVETSFQLACEILNDLQIEFALQNRNCYKKAISE